MSIVKMNIIECARGALDNIDLALHPRPVEAGALVEAERHFRFIGDPHRDLALDSVRTEMVLSRRDG